jgi:hypothetical protein
MHGVSFTETKRPECEMTAHLPVVSILRTDAYSPVYLPIYLDGVRLNWTQEQMAKFYGKNISPLKSEAKADTDIRSSGMVKFRMVNPRIRIRHWW